MSQKNKKKMPFICWGWYEALKDGSITQPYKDGGGV